MYWRSTVAARRVVGELQHHRPHHRDAVRCARPRPSRARYGMSESLRLRELPRDVDGLLVERPRHPVRVRAVQAAVRREQPERQPALEHGRRRACPRTRRCRGSSSRSRTTRATARRAASRPSTRTSTRSRRPSAPGTAGRPRWPSGRTARPRPRRARVSSSVEDRLGCRGACSSCASARGSEPSCQTTSVGIRSPKSVLNASTPWSSRRRSLPLVPGDRVGVGEVDERPCRPATGPSARPCRRRASPGSRPRGPRRTGPSAARCTG